MITKDHGFGCLRDSIRVQDGFEPEMTGAPTDSDAETMDPPYRTDYMGQILAVSFLSRFRVSQIPSQSVFFPQVHFTGTSVLVYRVGTNSPVNTPFVIDPASSTGVSIRLPISNIKKTIGSSARTRS